MNRIPSLSILISVFVALIPAGEQALPPDPFQNRANAQVWNASPPLAGAPEDLIFLETLETASPDGKFVAYVSARNLGMEESALWVARAGEPGGKVQIVASGEEEWVTHPVWSPDSARIAYLKVIRGQSSQYERSSRFEIWLVDPDGMNNRLLTDSPLLNPALGYGGKSDMAWITADEVLFHDHASQPASQYAAHVSSRAIRKLPTASVAGMGQIPAQPVEVPKLYQCDERWGQAGLGTCAGSTICSHGCAITATAMVFQYLGTPIDPGTLNAWLVDNGGYALGCLIYWATAANINPNITYVGSMEQDWERLKSELDAGYPVIVEVDTYGMHFVVVTGYEGDTFFINDPAYASRTTLDAYGNSFVRMQIYHGPLDGSSCSGPLLEYPERQAISTSQTIPFRWSAVSGCAFNGYTLRLKNTENMESGGTILYEAQAAGNTHTVTISTDNNYTDLYWGARAANAPNGASWTVRTFQVDPEGEKCLPATDPAGDDICIESAALKSHAAFDGWVREKNETANTGWGMAATSDVFLLGDTALDQQYRSLLHFDTSALPDDAVITKATLKIKLSSTFGADPFLTMGNIIMDIRSGAFYGNPALQWIDFRAAASQAFSGTIPNAPSEDWYAGEIKSAALPFINLTGNTQFRLRFYKDDNDNQSANIMRFHTGNDPDPATHPALIVEYYIP